MNRTRRRILVLGLTICVLAPARAAALQVTNDALAVTAATIAHVKPTFKGPWGVDPRPFRTRSERDASHDRTQWAVERTGAETEVLKALGASSARLEDVKVCVEMSPRGCRLHDVEYYVALSTPFVSGEMATIEMSLEANIDLARFPTSRMTMNARSVRYTLAKQSGRWKVVGEQLLGET